jgi:hypothetical protein
VVRSLLHRRMRAARTVPRCWVIEIPHRPVVHSMTRLTGRRFLNAASIPLLIVADPLPVIAHTPLVSVCVCMEVCVRACY